MFLYWQLLTLPLAITVGVPLYIFFRNSMVKKEKEEKDFSRRRVLRLTSINLALNSLAAAYFLVMYAVLSLGTTIDPLGLSFAACLFFSILFTFYGNGIYITSIVLEAYTMPQLRRIDYFKTQFIATHLFHGPISHILIYSGWLTALYFSSLVNIINPTLPVQVWPLLVGGLTTGVAYAVGQIYNKTAPYQFITGLILTTSLSLVLVLGKYDLSQLPVAAFFLTTGVSYVTVLLVDLIIERKKYGGINWDKSGY